jgi:hypothetical protein
MKPLKKQITLKASAPDAYLYEPEKKDKKVTDADLFVMSVKKREKKKNKK